MQAHISSKVRDDKRLYCNANGRFFLLLVLTSTHTSWIVAAMGLLMFSILSPSLQFFLGFCHPSLVQTLKQEYVKHVHLCLPFSARHHPDENKSVHHLCQGHQTPVLPYKKKKEKYKRNFNRTSIRVHLIAVHRLSILRKRQVMKLATEYNHRGNLELRLNEYNTSVKSHCEMLSGFPNPMVSPLSPSKTNVYSEMGICP